MGTATKKKATKALAAGALSVALGFSACLPALAGNATTWKQSIINKGKALFEPRPKQYGPGSGIADGPGVWMNIWNYPKVETPGEVESYVKTLVQYKIRNVFVQTSRSNTDAIVNRAGLSALIDTCHRNHIRVIAWSFAELVNPEQDADKLIAAGLFESTTGQKVDAVAGDLEGNLKPTKIEAYAARLRAKLGAKYPLIAVVYSPLNRSQQALITPWKVIANNFDVIAPMTYWAGKHHKFSDAYNYTYTTVQKIRELCGKPDLEIHVVGDGMGSSIAELEQFLKGCQAVEATSASLYPNCKATTNQLACMSHYHDHLPVNARFRLEAYRQFKQKGSLADTRDPSQSITRGKFYKLMADELLVPSLIKPKSQLEIEAKPVTEFEAMQMLINAGLISAPAQTNSSADLLSLPVYPKEALSIIAGILENQITNRADGKLLAGGHKLTSQTKRRAPTHWFIQPAYAESKAETKGQSHPMNYLDAAQMVLEARAGLK
jgi:hypothetical protein